MIEEDESGAFLPEFVESFQAMVDTPEAWEIANWYQGPHLIQDVSNYSDEEFRQAVVQDILQVTYYEQCTGKKETFTVDTLCRCIPKFQALRVIDALRHPEVAALLDTDKSPNLRIREDKAFMQAAMDFCGVYYQGYDWPDGLICLDRRAVEDQGGIDQVIGELMMEIEADIPSDKNKLH